MLDDTRGMHSIDRKRLILIADDEPINREILREMLKEDYEILFACDGEETLNMMRMHQTTLSLVLLDIMMPVMTGLDVLRTTRTDAVLSRIPIIVMTGEKDAEIESLELGAIDFIPKPYPALGVVLARVRRTIELMEDRGIIESAERDVLTGLYNKEFFYSYVAQMDQFHDADEMDAVLLDINHFHLVNDRYGKAYGDLVLTRLGNTIREIAKESGGIACRKGGDTSMLYIPHREDYEELMVRLADSLRDIEYGDSRIHLRAGVYPRADKTIDPQRRFDRAKMAADTVRENFAKNIGYYDVEFHERQLYAEQLIEEFSAAVSQNQFQVYYQPKFDIRPDVPVLASAEALVRWVHPELGMISPGSFIPLFEENGLIQKLDQYVWEETARQIRDWKDRLGFSIPVSVNVSRIDLFDPDLEKTLQDVLDKYSLSGEEFLLEVTESAYTEDSNYVISKVEKLRRLGFRIEMDDFGTGYSSLHMVSALPIDAMKLDLKFVHDAFRKGGNTHMMEVIIGIADYLSVPVIAEGVETEEQLRALKILGCDLVQGYFFSKPVPAWEFEPFILQRKEAEYEKQAAEASALQLDDIIEIHEEFKEETDGEIKLEKAIAEEAEGDKTDPDALKEEKPGLHLRTASIFFALLALVAAVALMVTEVSVSNGYQKMKLASDRYIEAQIAATDMEAGSDYLTDRVRCFVVTGEIQYLNDFYEEVHEVGRRDKAVMSLEELLNGESSTALENLNAALALSNELIGYEDKAMRLMIEAGDYDPADIPEDLAKVTLSEEERSMTRSEMREAAKNLVFDNSYMHYKDRIRENVRLCTQSLIRSSSQELEKASAQLTVLIRIQTVMTLVFLLVVLGFIVMITAMIRRPLTQIVAHMQNHEMVPPSGVEELRFVTRTYNRILEENNAAREKLSHEASHDALTGLYNRGAYDLWMSNADTEHIALLLVDVDYFKSVNDTYGHAVGDRVLKRVAEILKNSFRSVDIICRIGGDEFAVIMTRVNSSMKQLVENKIARANDMLQHPKDDLPPVSLSVGVAFSDRDDPQGDIFTDADTALYRVKEAGRKGCQIY
ncbi:MAG: EAL domain-containing protein [Mogibacterium sp.]|nr:EAL domain-containing protein [Mogibacterium sp.]